MQSKKCLSVLLAASCALLLPGCKVGPNYAPPEPNMPPEWRNAQESVTDANTLSKWWLVFDDAVMTDLIKQSSIANYDIQAAAARIAESRALRNATVGQYAPTIDATGSYSRIRESENGRFGGIGISSDPYDFYAVGFDTAWEIDVFGRIGRSVESAQAGYEASIEDWRAVQTTLFAEVARNYIELRSSQVRIGFAEENIRLQQETLKLTQGRFEAALAPKVDVAQAQLNLANTESEIPLLRINEAAAFNRLVVLTGRMPEELEAKLKQQGQMPDAPAGISAGIPAELLRRRPDVRQAERSLAAQTARIGVATANLYPSFSLSGVFNLQATDFSDVGDYSSRAYSFGPGFRWNLFNGNIYRSLVQAEEARTAQVAAAYESSVLRAVEEVENSLVGFVQQNDRRLALQRSVAAAKESVELLDALYKNGLTDFENVLVTQRALFVQQDRLVVSQSQVLQQAVALYKALGGGWDYEISSVGAD